MKALPSPAKVFSSTTLVVLVKVFPSKYSGTTVPGFIVSPKIALVSKLLG